MAVQSRANVRQQAELAGRRMIRDVMLEQQRAFFEQLSYAFVGGQGEGHWPVAAAITGEPGFLKSYDPQTLEIALTPDLFPKALAQLTVGDPVGLSGIEFHTRRRNRVNGRISRRDARGLQLRVDQLFGNCPQYIQARSLISGVSPVSAARWQQLDRWTSEATTIAHGADTCIVATASAAPASNERAEGCDVSHRGGRPGFIRVETELGGTLLTLPDFPGNRSFNTLGNLAVNPKIGLLILDFVTGQALSVRGQADIVWDPYQVGVFEGAERLLRIAVRDVQLGRGVLPGVWTAPGWARELARTGNGYGPSPRGNAM
jgi:uncharacterized protein